MIGALSARAALATALFAMLPLSGTLQGQAVDRVAVDPASIEIGVDQTASVNVAVLDASGDAVAGVPRQWFTNTPDLVSVDAEGIITGLRPGEGQVSVVAGGVAAFVTVHVLQETAELSATLRADELPVGTSAPLAIRALDAFGDVVPSPGARFTSADPSVAEVDDLGRVFGNAPGSTTIQASAGSATSVVPVEVVDRGELSYTLSQSTREARTGDVVRFSVMARPASGAPIPVEPAWTVSSPGAQIQGEGGEGVFVAEQAGTYRITAQIGDEAARSALITVTPRGEEARLVKVGRGPASHHNSGDTWAFEGVDGRDYAIIGTLYHDWAKVWDVTDPENPVLTDSLQADARRINDVKIHPNNRLGIITREQASNRRNGIILLDLADPAHPSVLSEYTETVTGGVHNVWIDGENDLVYACHNGTSDMHILDISDPANVREVGRWGLEKSEKTLHDVIVQDGYAYLSYWDDGVITLDVGAGTHGGTPTEPTFVSQFKYPIGNTHVAWRYGRYLFLGDEIFPADWDPTRPIEARGYVHVVDMIDPEQPVEVARYEVPEAGAHNLWAEDDKLYVGYYQAGLRVLDISGELRGDLYQQGRELAVIKTTDSDTVTPNWPMTWGAQVFKGNIFTSDLNSGLWIARLIEDSAVVF
jgi:hypothetical protein